MTWLMRLKPLAGAAVVLLVVSAGVAGQGGRQAPPPSQPTPTVQNLVRQQLELADRAVATGRRLVETGRVALGDGSLPLWERRGLEALRKSGAGRAEMIAALDKHIETMKQYEAIAEARREAARGTELEVYDARYRRLEAEIWLVEEKAR